MVVRPFIRVKEWAEISGQKSKTIHEQIRTGIFPFRIRRVGRSIWISARDLELIPPEEPQGKKAQDQVESLATTA